ncbi:hypothetical protein [Chromobacterium haemolyticum]|uniref:hypothetical protein n=1 Tax=Chromobacterium haemolyticum TaxID=394935 RepID=UPI001269F572|nr:hypothetical protein [Chromobacterium haemolyticum]
MSNDQIVALFASIGACLSAVATFLTVRQIAKQREASYRPELAFSCMHLECTKGPNDSSPIPTYWVAINKDGKTETLTHRFSLSIRNVGLGTAKAVSIFWSFPFDAVTKQVNELAQKSLSAAYFTFENGMLSLDSQDFGKSTSMWMNQKQGVMDYVLPAVVDHDPLVVTIPHAYIQIVSSLLYFAIRQTDLRQFPEVPPLVARMEYLDIGEAKHYATFSIQFQLSSIVGKGESITGYLEVKKVA